MKFDGFICLHLQPSGCGNTVRLRRSNQMGVNSIHQQPRVSKTGGRGSVNLAATEKYGEWGG